MTRSDFFQTILGTTAAATVESEAAAKDLGGPESRRLIALEFSQRFWSRGDMDRFRMDLAPFEQEFNCRFLILEGGVSAKIIATK